MRRIGPGNAWTRWLACVGVVTACAQVAEPTTTTAIEPATTTTATTTTTVSTTTTTTVAASTTTRPEVAPPGALLVLGNWGSGTLPQGAVAGAMARYAEENRVAAVLTTGDNFYSDDTEFLLEPMDWVFQGNIPFWITWGDRDVETTSRVEAVDEAFGSPRWSVHEWGAVDVIILDSTQVSSDEQIDFLGDALEGSEAPAIVVFHHPPLTCDADEDNVAVLESWVTRFDDDVVMVLSGHDHNYQRFEAGGVTYVVSGGGGSPLDELTSCPADHPERVAGETIHHFLVLTRSGEGITVEVVDVNGGLVDSFAVPLS